MHSAKDAVSGFSELPEQDITETSIVPALEENKFYPVGAIAFFVCLVILCLVIWFGIYFIMLDRV